MHAEICPSVNPLHPSNKTSSCGCLQIPANKTSCKARICNFTTLSHRIFFLVDWGSWLTLNKTIPWFEGLLCSHFYLLLQLARPLLPPQVDVLLLSPSCYRLTADAAWQWAGPGCSQSPYFCFTSWKTKQKKAVPVKPSRLTGKLSREFAPSQQWCCLVTDEECCLSAFLCS